MRSRPTRRSVPDSCSGRAGVPCTRYGLSETTATTEPMAAWLERVTADSEMGRRFREVDWAATTLGPVEGWSASLRTAAGVCLTSRSPMLLVWGPDLVKIYNDGYRPILGSAKHPMAFGTPAVQVWPEIWNRIGPMFHGVLAGGPSTWDENQLLEIDRHGFIEEAYFTWSYSPVVDDDGSIGGVLDACMEVTGTVLSHRRLACLGHLASELVGSIDVAEVCRRAVEVLGAYADDLPEVDLYLDAGDALVRIASTGHRGAVPATPGMQRALESGETAYVYGTPAAPGFERDVTVKSPLGPDDSGDMVGVLVMRTSGSLSFDDSYAAYVSLVANTVGAALTAAFRRSSELGEHRRVSTTLQSSMLTPVDEGPHLAVRYRPAAGNLSIGGDWYDVVDLKDGKVALLVGDCVGHGLDAATRMAQLRSASRALLLEGRGPGATLEGLDRFAESIEGAVCTTVLCAIVDPATGTLRYASAGHPPPLLAGGPGGARWLDGGRSAPLCVGGGAERDEAMATILDGASLVLFTDGLVERRGEVLDAGLERLRDVVIARDGADAAELADHLLADLQDPEDRDDIALVVYRTPT